MMPTKVEKVLLPSKDSQKISKAKRRRLRKNKLVQTPQEDGGEAQAELTADIQPLVDTLDDHLVSPKPQIISSSSVQEKTLYHTVTFTAVSQTEITVSPKKSKLKTELESKKDINVSESKNLSTYPGKSEILNASGSIINPEMADKEKPKSPHKPPATKNPSCQKQSQTRSPKVSLSKDGTTPAQSAKSDQPDAAPTAEKTREEIMAERKAKKAEKSSKKGKVGKENSKPSSEDKSQITVVKDDVTPKTVKVAAPTSVLDTASKPAAVVSSVKTEEKSKAALKEERRLKQEAQRAAKAAAATKSQEPAHKEKTKVAPKEGSPDGKSVTKPKTSSKKETHLAKLFSHLQRRSEPTQSAQNIHPAIIKLGLQYSKHQVSGSNARAVALMRAMKQVVEDYKTPPQSELRRDLEARMQTYVEYLDQCRPISVSMINAMRDLKNKLQQLPLSLSDDEAKKFLIAAIDGHDKEDGFIDKIDLDCRSVSFNVVEKIKDDDVILTYGCSSLVQRVLMEALDEGKKFRVVVVGARPWKEAEKMLCQLTAYGLRCSYLLISAISSVMKEVNKVLLGAHAILANGYVMARAGSSQVALIAHSFNVPVIVCCETYKFCDRVQTDAFVYNELGEADELVPGLKMTNLTQCVLAYDVTPPELVSAVVTEVSMLPCSSVPVVLHMQSSETRLKRRSTAAPAKA